MSKKSLSQAVTCHAQIGAFHCYYYGYFYIFNMQQVAREEYVSLPAQYQSGKV